MHLYINSLHYQYEKKVENKHSKAGVLLRTDIPDPDEPEILELFVSEWKEQVSKRIS
jgi:hypothetical protein